MGPNSIPAPDQGKVEINGLNGSFNSSELELGEEKVSSSISDIERLINEGVIKNID